MVSMLNELYESGYTTSNFDKAQEILLMPSDLLEGAQESLVISIDKFNSIFRKSREVQVSNEQLFLSIQSASNNSDYGIYKIFLNNKELTEIITKKLGLDNFIFVPKNHSGIELIPDDKITQYSITKSIDITAINNTLTAMAKEKELKLKFDEALSSNTYGEELSDVISHLEPFYTKKEIVYIFNFIDHVSDSLGYNDEDVLQFILIVEENCLRCDKLEYFKKIIKPLNKELEVDV